MKAPFDGRPGPVAGHRFNRRQALVASAAGASLLLAGRPAHAQDDAAASTSAESAEGNSSASAAMPSALFVGHGGPDLIRREDRRVQLRNLLPGRPSAVIAVTPHRRTDVITLAGAEGGRALRSFPKRFNDVVGPVDYAPPAAPDLADKVVDRLKDAKLFAKRSGHPGFDHTVWGPMALLFPEADVPLLEIGMPFFDAEGFVSLGRVLGPLADDGVLLLASGQLTHNLAEVGNMSSAVPPASWAEAFDQWATEKVLARDAGALVEWREQAPKAWVAHPDDGAHFAVLLVAAGFALGSGAGWSWSRSSPGGFDGGTMSTRDFALG